jgi:murein tripeptide amidase MpaA
MTFHADAGTDLMLNRVNPNPSNTFQMLTKYDNSGVITFLMNHLDFYILPVFNVDGYAYTWTKVNADYVNHRIPF